MGKACAEHSKDKVIHFCRKSNCDAKSRIICNSCVNMGNHKKHFHMSLVIITKKSKFNIFLFQITNFKFILIL